MRPRLAGGAVFVVGYVLSPLSWWNDALVNLPIAYGVASLVSLVSRRLFLPAMVGAYWATNVIGLVMMSRAAGRLVRTRPRHGPARELLMTALISAVYTILVVVLIRAGVLRAAFDWR